MDLFLVFVFNTAVFTASKSSPSRDISLFWTSDFTPTMNEVMIMKSIFFHQKLLQVNVTWLLPTNNLIEWNFAYFVFKNKLIERLNSKQVENLNQNL